MATRFYLGQRSPLKGGTPAFESSWETTVSAIRQHMGLEKFDSALASNNISDSATSGVEDVLHKQFIASQGFASSGTLSGTFSYVFRCLTGNTNALAYLQVVLKVLKPDFTLRGVAFAGHTATGIVATAGAFNQQTGTTASTRIGNAIALTNTAYQAGDLLCFELGLRYTGATTTTYSSAINYGDPVATADFALTAGLTTTLVPWLELSQTIALADDGLTRLHKIAVDAMRAGNPSTRLHKIAVDVLTKKRDTSKFRGFGIPM